MGETRASTPSAPSAPSATREDPSQRVLLELFEFCDPLEGLNYERNDPDRVGIPKESLNAEALASLDAKGFLTYKEQTRSVPVTTVWLTPRGLEEARKVQRTVRAQEKEEALAKK